MTNELVVVNAETYPILVAGNQIGKVIKDNMCGEQVTPADLIKIKIPTGGETTWMVPTSDGTVAKKTLDGVIVHLTRRRAYWKSKDPTGQPPDCLSNDMEIGCGEPGGECEHCPLNAFGSGVKQDGSPSRGKACKETKLLFLLMPGEFLPHVIAVTPGSLKAMKKWQLGLKVPYSAITVSLALKEERNPDGVKYAQVVPTQTSILDPESARGIATYAGELASVFDATGFEPSDADSTQEV